MKKIIITRKTMPSSLVPYGDLISVYSANGLQMFSCACSSNPNPFKPSLRTLKWDKCYAQVKPGTFRWSYDGFDHKFGKGILVTTETMKLALPTTTATAQNDWTASEVFIHKGYSKFWRGSMACFTIPPDRWGIFISHFRVGDTGTLVLREMF